MEALVQPLELSTVLDRSRLRLTNYYAPPYSASWGAL